MLFLDGVYAENKQGNSRFYRVKAPAPEELASLAHIISHRVARFLERKGMLERDIENSYLQLEAMEEDSMQQLHGHSISYRIATGSQQGRKIFTLQTLPAEAYQRDKLERLCRYISRSAISEKRLAQTSNGTICYQLKTPYRDGTAHVIFEPLDFLARLDSLGPKNTR